MHSLDFFADYNCSSLGVLPVSSKKAGELIAREVHFACRSHREHGMVSKKSIFKATCEGVYVKYLNIHASQGSLDMTHDKDCCFLVRVKEESYVEQQTSWDKCCITTPSAVKVAIITAAP